MSLRDYLRKRRQRKARKGYEREKTRQEVASHPKAMDPSGRRGKGGRRRPQRAVIGRLHGTA